MLRQLICMLTLLLVLKLNGYCQSIAVAFGPVFTHTNAITPVVNGGDDFQNTDYMFSFSYEQFFKDRNFSITASYGSFNGCTFIQFEEGGWIGGGGVSLAKGFCGGVKIRRYDFGLSYLLTKAKKKFYLKPFFAAGIQTSSLTGVEFWRYDGLPIAGPDYFEKEPPIAESRSTFQIVPSLGLRTGFVFWKRLDIGLSFQSVYAFKSYQKMYLDYNYKGIDQPRAEYESTGTGLFVTVGVGYRFAKLIK